MRVGLFRRSGKVEQRAHSPGFSKRWTTGEDVTSRDWDLRGTSSMRLSIVYGCISRIANRISAMPLEIQGSDVRPGWLDTPDPFTTRGWGLTMRDIVNQIVISMLIHGNAFIAVGRSGGRIQEIQVLDPNCVEITREDGDIFLEVEGKKPTYEVLVVRMLTLPGEVRGLSPIESCMRLLEVGIGGQEVAARFHEQALNIPAVIQTKQEVTKSQTDMIGSQLQNRHGGSSKSHAPLILGQAEWKSVSFDAEQAQFIESRHFNDAQVAAHLFGVDPSMMGNPSKGSSDVYQNVELRSFELLLNALLPIMERIETGLNTLLNQGVTVKFNFDVQLRGDVGTRYRTYKAAAEISQMLGQPLMTINEMREREGLPPVDGGDTMGSPSPEMMPTDDEMMPAMSESNKDADGHKVDT